MDIVVCVDKNWGIGFGGTQTVVVKEDRKHFRTVTGHGTVIVGRKTLADFPGGKPLKNRKNIVLTRNTALSVEGAVMAHSLEEVLELSRGDENVYVIGGDSVYKEFLPYCRRAYLTIVYADPQADSYFPNLDELPNWSVEDEGEELLSESGVRYKFVTYKNSWVKEGI